MIDRALGNAELLGGAPDHQSVFDDGLDDLAAVHWVKFKCRPPSRPAPCQAGSTTLEKNEKKRLTIRSLNGSGSVDPPRLCVSSNMSLSLNLLPAERQTDYDAVVASLRLHIKKQGRGQHV